MKTIFALALLLVAARPLAAAEASKPNILFIHTDDQCQRALGCYRDEGAWPWARTPSIDRARGGGCALQDGVWRVVVLAEPCVRAHGQTASIACC